jgi:2-succinyl-6-hydroxy-2,4-cyclohexadiene-1-carboxylate synthase
VSENVVLLHGFGGTRRAFDAVVEHLAPTRYLPLALDLPGHGSERAAESPITFAACVEHVLTRSSDRFTLCGYSMGGRVALHVALSAPERVERLVLVACSPGIEDPAERHSRVEADERLATELEEEPYEQFIERWRTQPLFANDPPEVGALAREDQRRNDPTALAAVLRGIGTGKMRPLWSRLAQLEMPVVVLVGDRDSKFTALGRRMVDLISDSELVIAAGGHGLLHENPAALGRVIDQVDD